MRAARTTLAALAAAAAVAGPGAAPAMADGITVSPAAPLPGERIHISVAGCSVGPTAHVARSGAFTAPVTLYGKGDAGEGDPRLRQHLRPARYPITASCGATTVRGEVDVAAGAPPASAHAPGGVPPAGHTGATPFPPGGPAATISARPAAAHGSGGSGLGYWLAGGAVVLLAGGAGLFARRRHGGH